MSLWDRFWWTLGREWEKLTSELSRWWLLASDTEKMMVVAATCAVLMILSVSRSRRAKTVDLDKKRSRQIHIAQFYGALAVIGLFTFGVNLAVTNFGGLS